MKMRMDSALSLVLRAPCHCLLGRYLLVAFPLPYLASPRP